MKVETKTYEEDVKCGSCGWAVGKLYSFSGDDIDTEGLCAHCFMEVLIEYGYEVTGVSDKLKEKGELASSNQKLKVVTYNLRKAKETLKRINEKYLNWYNSNSDAISKHTADTIFEIGEILESYREEEEKKNGKKQKD